MNRLNRIPRTVSDLPLAQASVNPNATALVDRAKRVSYASLVASAEAFAKGLTRLGVRKSDRVCIYLSKCSEHVVAMLGAARAGAAFVPINPVLKADQATHILQDSGSSVLITSEGRLTTLLEDPERQKLLKDLVVILTEEGRTTSWPLRTVPWPELLNAEVVLRTQPIESDMAAILYTSGSTGRPKGVVLSHKNIVTGALSVAEYLQNGPEDRILSILPLSFDAGMSQLTTAFASGASVVLLDYVLPQDVARACVNYSITGITGVPPLWMQLVELEWPAEAISSLRYFANTGGKMPRETLMALRAAFPKAEPFLMYGLTEAFRSTYLPPSEIASRPDSIGKAIPSAEVLVVRPDGTFCDPGEPGELVHRGPLVAMGYWRDPARTVERFRPAPGQPDGIPLPELAVWSGDTVFRDEEGFLYFVGRSDDMIKTSGYRVSPTEVEEIAFASGLVAEAVALGIPDERLGQRIVLVAKPRSENLEAAEMSRLLIKQFRQKAPGYLVPSAIVWRENLPRNANGKLDRRALAGEVQATAGIDS
ncbi:MAG: acyl-CoA ligase (AMP-forming), exosortase A system-associated [Roseibium album]|uniref:acyl-CoA ligase (AMP-forming), exosortase A system-associated n=1 Tax=Roseibium album TaxID=311410 RepID=UPI0032EDDC90